MVSLNRLNARLAYLLPLRTPDEPTIFTENPTNFFGILCQQQLYWDDIPI